MENKMKYLLTLSLSLMCIITWGQNDEVTTEASSNRAIEKGQRLKKAPSIIDTIVPTVVVDYPLLQLKYETNTEIEKINPASIDTKTKLSKLYKTYAKIGIGSTLMPLGEVYYSNTRSRKYVYGAHLKHLSSFGKIKGYAPAQFDRTGVHLFAGIKEKKYSVLGSVNYSNYGFNYYGISDTLGLTRDSIHQRLQRTGFDVTYASFKKDSAHLNYTLGLQYQNMISKKPENLDKKWRVRENYIGLTTSAFYKHKSETYRAQFNVTHNNYNYGIKDSVVNFIDSGIVQHNTVLQFKPSITTRLFKNKFKAELGVNLLVDVQHKTRIYVSPVAEIQYSFLNNLFIPYAGITGGLKQNTFSALTDVNPYILTRLNMVNERTPIAFYGGIKGTISDKISFNTSIEIANVKNKLLFVQDTTYSRGNQFTVIADTMNTVKIEGSISYQLKEEIKVDAIARFNSYELKNSSYAWQLPRFEFIVRGSYNLFNKFIFNLDFSLEEGRKALLYTPMAGSTMENGQIIENLGIIADANLGVEYRYNNRISAFLQVNNIAAQKYLRWQNYQVMPIQVLGGVTFRF